MSLFRRWNGMSASPSPEDAKSPSRSAGIRPPWSTGLKDLSSSTSPLNASVYQRGSQRKEQIQPFLTYPDHHLSRVDAEVLRPSSSWGASAQNHFSLEHISPSGVLRQTTSPSTLAQFVSPSLLSTHSAPADDHVNKRRIYTCAVDGNQSKRLLSRLYPQGHLPHSTSSSRRCTKHPDPAYCFPCHCHQGEASLALLKHSEVEEGTKPPNDHLVTCTSSEEPRKLLKFRLWPLPLHFYHKVSFCILVPTIYTDIDHTQKPLSASNSPGTLVSGGSFDVPPDTMSSDRDLVSSVSSKCFFDNRNKLTRC